MSEVDKVAEDAKLHSKMTKQEKLDSVLGKTITLILEDNGWVLVGRVELEGPGQYLLRYPVNTFRFSLSEVRRVTRHHIILESRGRVL